MEHVRVFSVSTIPRTGFIARFAIPVLNAIEVMSRMAVPVVSEPVPAVVGTAHGIVNACRNSVDSIRTSDEWPQLFLDRQTLSDWRIDEIEQVGVLVHGKPRMTSWFSR